MAIKYICHKTKISGFYEHRTASTVKSYRSLESNSNLDLVFTIKSISVWAVGLYAGTNRKRKRYPILSIIVCRASPPMSSEVANLILHYL